MKIFRGFILLIASLMMVGCGVEEAREDRLTVAVSIVPQETFVKAVAGDLVDVVTLIPSGASPANYQPSPKEMAAFSDAGIYFSIGVATEAANILPNIASQNDHLRIVELAEHVDAVYDARYFADDEDHLHDEHEEADHDENEEADHDHEGRDPHIWMSPKRVIVMVQMIRDTLIEEDPNNQTTYTDNAEAYIESLRIMDESLQDTFSDLQGEAFIVMHPSVGYFADDYGLDMIAIEEDGKDASVSHMQTVIDFALENGIKVVFYQQEFDSTQAKTIADEIDGEVIEYEPLSGDYINSLKKMATAFEQVFMK